MRARARAFSWFCHVGRAYGVLAASAWVAWWWCCSQTTTGQIEPDLSNYDDDGSGGGSAWPCMIDNFVEWVVAQ